ncbi:hypothetical protein SRHO_G00117010 [Serrasalmus rhombeus]
MEQNLFEAEFWFRPGLVKPIQDSYLHLGRGNTRDRNSSPGGAEPRSHLARRVWRAIIRLSSLVRTAPSQQMMDQVSLSRWRPPQGASVYRNGCPATKRTASGLLLLKRWAPNPQGPALKEHAHPES